MCLLYNTKNELNTFIQKAPLLNNKGPAVDYAYKYMMRVIVMKDYPDNLGEVIQSILYSDYTLTGYYGDTGLEWVLEYRGTRSTLLLEMALSEYILDTATVPFQSAFQLGKY